MADLLILNIDHWMDKLTEDDLVEYTKKHSNFMDKYNRRSQKGDVIEVQEDNHWADSQTGKGKFKILRLPGVKKVDAIHYVDKLEKLTGVSIEGEPQYETVRRFKYRVDTSTLDAKLATLSKVEQPTATDVHKVEKIDDLTNTFITKTEASELLARA